MGGDSRERLAEIQRARLLAAAVGVVDELGCAGATVAHITRRARVSRRTFYELFPDRDSCLAALIRDVATRLQCELEAAQLGDLQWRERMRAGLWVVLCFFDREPALARVCVVHSAGGARRLLECRQELLVRLARLVDQGREQAGAKAAGCSPLTAEGVVGAALAIAQGRLLRRERGPLAGLLAELMGIVVLPYLGAGVARRERERPLPPAQVVERSLTVGVSGVAGEDPLRGVPMRLTYRTARVLEGVSAFPGASNRQLAGFAGIGDQGQVSKLLARLERLGLLTNAAHGKGEPNAWQLTATGREVARGIQIAPASRGRASADEARSLRSRRRAA
jgi:AcrR family transcriptional regulator